MKQSQPVSNNTNKSPSSRSDRFPRGDKAIVEELVSSYSYVDKWFNVPTNLQRSTLVQLQHLYGNAQLQRILQSKVIQRDFLTRDGTKWRVEVINGGEGQGIQRDPENGKIFKGDTLIIYAWGFSFNGKTDTQGFAFLTDSHSLGTPQVTHNERYIKWQIPVLKVGLSNTESRILLEGQEAITYKKQFYAVADLEDFTLACVNALGLIVSKFSTAFENLNNAAKAYREAYIDQESALEDAHAEERMVGDLLFGAALAASGGMAGGTVGGILKGKEFIKNRGVIGEGITDSVKDLVKFSVRSTPKLLGSHSSPSVKGDSIAPPNNDPIGSSHGDNSPAGQDPYAFFSGLASQIYHEEAIASELLRNLINQARTARDANSQADFDEDPEDLVNRDEVLKALINDLKTEKKDYLRSLWHTWLENYAYVLEQATIMEADTGYAIHRNMGWFNKLKKHINRAATQCGENGDEWIKVYAPKALEKAKQQAKRERKHVVSIDSL